MLKKSNFPNGVVIDTNVFVHLFNLQNNTCGHIGELLTTLANEKITLLVDKGGRIDYEYNDRNVKDRLADSDDRYAPILGCWFLGENREKITVNCEDNLMSSIKEIIHGDKKNDENDRVFLYVTIKKDSVLITNDKKGMIDENRNDGKRRKKILDLAKDRGPEYKHVKIWVSQEAYNAMMRSA